jgi:hypothetical protein
MNARISLGRQPPPGAEAGAQELVPDALVVPDCLSDLRNVRAGHLAYLGHRVDERNLGGKKCVRGHLDELGSGEVGAHDGRAGREDGCVGSLKKLPSGVVRRADDDAVRAQCVLDREPLPQELRVPEQLDSRVAKQRRQPRGGADRHSRLAHDNSTRPNPLTQREKRGVDKR